jgi:hypothetical protein
MEALTCEQISYYKFGRQTAFLAYGYAYVVSGVPCERTPVDKSRIGFPRH